MPLLPYFRHIHLLTYTHNFAGIHIHLLTYFIHIFMGLKQTFLLLNAIPRFNHCSLDSITVCTTVSENNIHALLQTFIHSQKILYETCFNKVRSHQYIGDCCNVVNCHMFDWNFTYLKFTYFIEMSHTLFNFTYLNFTYLFKCQLFYLFYTYQ